MGIDLSSLFDTLSWPLDVSVFIRWIDRRRSVILNENGCERSSASLSVNVLLNSVASWFWVNVSLSKKNARLWNSDQSRPNQLFHLEILELLVFDFWRDFCNDFKSGVCSSVQVIRWILALGLSSRLRVPDVCNYSSNEFCAHAWWDSPSIQVVLDDRSAPLV